MMITWVWRESNTGAVSGPGEWVIEVQSYLNVAID